MSVEQRLSELQSKAQAVANECHRLGLLINQGVNTTDSPNFAGLSVGGNPVWHWGNMPSGGGAWTPYLYGSTTAGSPTHNARVGQYYRIGNLVMLRFYINCSSLGGATGGIRIGGLPYIPDLGDVPTVHTIIADMTSTNGGRPMGVNLRPDGRLEMVLYKASGDFANYTHSDWGGWLMISGTVIYKV